jgi:hypothetical protein
MKIVDKQEDIKNLRRPTKQGTFRAAADRRATKITTKEFGFGFFNEDLGKLGGRSKSPTKLHKHTTMSLIKFS